MLPSFYLTLGISSMRHMLVGGISSAVMFVGNLLQKCWFVNFIHEEKKVVKF